MLQSSITNSTYYSGAGIGGIALAVVLGKFERPEVPLVVNIYERHPEVAVFGAGISVWQRTWRVMELLGLDEELSAEAERPPNKKLGEYLSDITKLTGLIMVQARASSTGALTERRITIRSTGS